MSLLAFVNCIGLAFVHWVTQKKKQIGERVPLSYLMGSAKERLLQLSPVVDAEDSLKKQFQVK